MPRIIKPAVGTFTTADITVDSSGRIIAASTGSAGGNNMVRTFDSSSPNKISIATILSKETQLIIVKGVCISTKHNDLTCVSVCLYLIVLNRITIRNISFSLP